MIFDLNNVDSFNSIKNYWINEVESYTDESAVIILIGNKCDQARTVSEADVKAFVDSKNLHYYETSAKTGANVGDMFIGIAQHLTEKRVQGKGGQNPDSGFKKLEDVKEEQSGGSRCQC